MTPDERALRDAYLAELWPRCREVSHGHREAARKEHRAMQRQMEEWQAAGVHNPSRGLAGLIGDRLMGTIAPHPTASAPDPYEPGR